MSDDELPNEYTPEELRPAKLEPRVEVVYACGYHYKTQGGVKSYGMFAGPHPDLKEMLEKVPDPMEKQTTYIIRFDLDGTSEELYFWFKPRTGTPCWWRAGK